MHFHNVEACQAQGVPLPVETASQEGGRLAVAADAYRRGVRVRLEARLQAGPSTSWPRCRFYGGMQELEHFVMPDLHHEDHLRRAQMSGCRSAVDVEPTANRILTTDSSIVLHAHCTHELTLTTLTKPQLLAPIPTAHR